MMPLNREILDFQPYRNKSTDLPSNSPPATGRLRYVTDGLRGFYYDTGTAWVRIAPFITVKAWGAVGNGTTNDYAAFSQANTDIAAGGGGTLYVPTGTYPINTNLAFADSVQLYMEAGAMLAPAAGVTISNVTLANPSRTQVFTGLGTVTLSTRVDALYPEWWGALTDGTNASATTAAFNAALAQPNPTVDLGVATYLLNALTWSTAKRTRLLGQGRGATTLKVNSGASTILNVPPGVDRRDWFCEISGLTIEGNNQSSTPLVVGQHSFWTMRDVYIKSCAGTALQLRALYDSHIENVFVENAGDTTHPAVIFDDQSNDSFNNVDVINFHIENGAQDCIFLDLVTGTGVIDGCTFVGLKLHGQASGTHPVNYPLLRVGARAVGNIFLHGIYAWGSGSHQIEVNGSRNVWVGGHFSGAQDYFAELNGGLSRFIAPNFNGPYGTAYFNEVGINNVFFEPLFDGGTLVAGANRYRAYAEDNQVNTGLDIIASDGVNLRAVSGIAGDLTVAKNLRGHVTLSGATATATVTFVTNEINNNYYVVMTVVGWTGTPAAGSRQIFLSSKSTTGFVAQAEAAPGVGNTVLIDWVLVR